MYENPRKVPYTYSLLRKIKVEFNYTTYVVKQYLWIKKIKKKNKGFLRERQNVLNSKNLKEKKIVDKFTRNLDTYKFENNSTDIAVKGLLKLSSE